MNEVLRFIFAGALVFSLLMLYKAHEETTAPPRTATPATSSLTSIDGDGDGESSNNNGQAASNFSDDADLPVPTQNLKSANQSVDSTPTAPTLPSDEITVETDWLVAKISDEGGTLFDLRLKKHDLAGAPFPLLQQGERYYIAQSGLLGQKGIPNHKTTFRPTTPNRHLQLSEGGADTLTLTLTANTDNLTIEKKFVFAKSSYNIDIIYTIKNNGEATPPLFSYYRLSHDKQEPIGFSSILPTFFGAGLYTKNDKFQKISFDDISDATYPKKSDNGWVGVIQRYFAVVWLPPEGDREFFVQEKNNIAHVGVILPIGSVATDDTATITTALFAGGQEQNILNNLHEQGIAPGINLVVDYGWLTFIAVLLFAALQFIQSYVINWGIAIILLTFFVKLIFYPLSSAAYRSMAKMKDEAPRIKQIQEKYGNDKQQMQKEMMELYRTKKINPLGGCLPILVQIPVFIALYWVLLGSIEIRHVPFYGWIDDLSSPDPYFILSLLMGLASYYQTTLSPAPPDPTQAMVMKLLPVGFAVFSVFFPSGLVLYWLVNTVLSIAQQQYIARQLKKATAAA